VRRVVRDEHPDGRGGYRDRQLGRQVSVRKTANAVRAEQLLDRATGPGMSAQWANAD
jgi:hypothetical protein